MNFLLRHPLLGTILASIRAVTKALSILLLLALPINSATFSETPAISCRKLMRTLGTEWEVQGVHMDPPKGFNPFHSTRGIETALANFGFRKLFIFFGKSKKGNFEPHLIPERLLSDPRIDGPIKQGVIKITRKDQETYISNWDTMPAGHFIGLMRELMEVRGADGVDLKLRKRPEAWKNKNNRFDKMIPDQVAEEWQMDGKSFANLEFPMQGSVKTASEVRGFLRNLWLRLELFKPGYPRLKEKLDLAVVHMHWVPEISGLPENQRRDVYRAVIGYWGDANDSQLVQSLNVLEGAILPNGKWPMNEKDASFAFDSVTNQGSTESILPLSRSLYQRLTPTKNGIEVADRSNDLDPGFDANFPPGFKLLAFGLRGIYGQKTLPPNAPIPRIGIESRTEPSLSKTVESLPKDSNGSEVDLEALLLHARNGSRGIITHQDQLLAQAEKIGIQSEFIRQLTDTMKSYRWPKELMLGVYLLPLNDWLDHPLVKLNLERLGHSEKIAAIARYKVALNNYKERINDLMRARQNPHYAYQPDWTAPLEGFSDGINRVYPRADYPPISFFSSENDPNVRFRVIAASEAVRFIAEANLASLLRMPGR